MCCVSYCRSSLGHQGSAQGQCEDPGWQKQAHPTTTRCHAQGRSSPEVPTPAVKCFSPEVTRVTEAHDPTSQPLGPISQGNLESTLPCIWKNWNYLEDSRKALQTPLPGPQSRQLCQDSRRWDQPGQEHSWWDQRGPGRVGAEAGEGGGHPAQRLLGPSDMGFFIHMLWEDFSCLQQKRGGEAPRVLLGTRGWLQCGGAARGGAGGLGRLWLLSGETDSCGCGGGAGQGAWSRLRGQRSQCLQTARMG